MAELFDTLAQAEEAKKVQKPKVDPKEAERHKKFMEQLRARK